MDKPDKRKESSPEQKHQQQFLLEILLPLLIVVLIVVALIVLAITFSGSKGAILSQWADISLILMIVPVLFACLIVGIILFLLIKLMGHVNGSLPPIATLIRSTVNQWAARIQNFFTLPVEPVIKVNSFIAGIKQFFTSLHER